MNKSLCNTCGNLVPCAPVEHNSKIYLAKDCPDCGKTETLISSDAQRYWAKHELDSGFDYHKCEVDCLHCRHPKAPNIVFLDTTNRCNMICPICINNTPSDGFLFEPDSAYFEKIINHLAHMDPIPSLQLFGGEPLVRKDIIDIIRLARKRGIPTRVVTNGIRLADEDYCRRVLEKRPTLLISYDGDDPRTYEILRGDAGSLIKKQRALDNISRYGKATVVLMSVVAKGLNDRGMGGLISFCHQHRKVVRGIYLMPLAHTWEEGKVEVEPERITGEDMEQLVDELYPAETVSFIPAGLLGGLTTLRKYLKFKPIPFAGAHPNCESFYLLFSDGEKYIPVDHYLKTPLHDIAQNLIQIEGQLARSEKRLKTSWFGAALAHLSLSKRYLRLTAQAQVGWLLLRKVRWARGLQGSGLGKIGHFLAILGKQVAGKRMKYFAAKHTKIQSILQIIVLPFEDKSTLETYRLERCPSAFAHYDPKLDRVRFVPVCAWSLFKKQVLKEIGKNLNSSAVEPVNGSVPSCPSAKSGFAEG